MHSQVPLNMTFSAKLLIIIILSITMLTSELLYISSFLHRTFASLDEEQVVK